MLCCALNIHGNVLALTVIWVGAPVVGKSYEQLGPGVEGSGDKLP